jgi:hypothetical protein
MAKHSNDILTWARRGAEARWVELQAEVASLVKAFPHLSSHTSRGRKPAAAIAASSNSAPRRRRSKMTPAQRKAVGERMKKYWAERRKAATKK